MNDSAPISSIPEDSMIWNFVASRIRNADGRLSIFRVGESTWHEFKKLYSSAKNTAQFYANRFELHLVPNLTSAPFGDHQKLDLFWALGLKITKEFLKKVEISHQVKCDSDWYVINYANMGEHEIWDNVNWQYPQQILDALPEKRIRKPTYKIRQESEEHAEDVCHKKIQKMWAFLAAQIRNPSTHELKKAIVSPDTWQKFLGARANDEEALELHEYYLEELAPNLHLMKFRQDKVLDLYWALEIVVNKEYLKKIRRNYDLTMDRRGKIEVYSKKPVRVKAEQFEPSKHNIQKSKSPSSSKKVKIEPDCSNLRVKSEVVDSQEEIQVENSQKSLSCDSIDNESSGGEMDDTLDIFRNSPSRHLDNSLVLETSHDSPQRHLKPCEASENTIDEMADDDAIQKRLELQNSSLHHLKSREASENSLEETIDDGMLDDTISELSGHLQSSESFMDEMDDDYDPQMHQKRQLSSRHSRNSRKRRRPRRQKGFSDDEIDFNDTLQESQTLQEESSHRHEERENVENEKRLRGRISQSMSNDMWSFLRNEIRDMETGDPKKVKLTVDTWRRFNKMRGAKKALGSLEKHFYSNVAPKLHECPFNLDSKLELYWSLDLKINRRFFDSLDHIYNFEFSPIDTLLSYKPKTHKECQKWWPESSIIWEFVLEHSRNSCGTLVNRMVDFKSEEFRLMFNTKFRVEKDAVEIREYFNNDLIPHLHEEQIPLSDKLAIHYVLQIPIGENFLNHCQNFAQISVNPARIVERFQMIVVQQEIDKILDEDPGDIDDMQPQEDVPSTSGCQVLTRQNREVFEMMNRGPSKRSKNAIIVTNPRGIPAEKFLGAVKKLTKKIEKFDHDWNVVEDEYEKPSITESTGQGKFVSPEHVHQFFSKCLSLAKSRISK